MPGIYTIFFFIASLFLGACGSSSLGGITLDAPVADIEGAGTDRAKLCGTIVDAPDGAFLRIVNTLEDHTNSVDVVLGNDGSFNVMVLGAPTATYLLTVMDADGDAISETSAALVRGERVPDDQQDCGTGQVNLVGGAANSDPNEGSTLDEPTVTVEALSNERAQICGTVTGAPAGAILEIVSVHATATNIERVTLAGDGSFSVIVIGDSATVVTATVLSSSGTGLSPALNITLGDVVAAENLTCSEAQNILF